MESSSPVFVSVIVPTYRDWEALCRCVDALKKQSYEATCYEIIVANNDPEDSRPRNLSGVKVLDVEEPGSYAARNAALRVADGDILAFLDADCIADQHWLANAVSFLEANTEVDRIAGHVQLLFESENLTAAELYEKAFSFNQCANAAAGVSVTANLIARRAVFEAVGFFDDRLLSGGDMEWNRRATKQGYTIRYRDDCIVHHPARGSMAALRKKTRRTCGGVVKGVQRPGFWGLRSLLPPINTVAPLRQRGFSRREVLSLFFTEYYLKLYRFHVLTMLRLGLDKPSRS